MSTLKTNTLSNVAGTASTAIENAIHGSAKAWVNFDGQNTPTIRASFNVSSITDDGIGYYTVNFTTAMPDTNYTTLISARRVGSASGYVGHLRSVFDGGAYTSSGPSLVFQSVGSGKEDPDIATVAVFR